MRASIRELDAELPLDGMGTVDALVATSLSQRRFAMLLMAIFAGLALVLAMVGIYGVIAYSVTQATQEIGIRMALGARRADVLGMVFGYAGLLIAAGLVIGGAAALGAGRFLASQLFEVKPTDPATFAAVAARPAGHRHSPPAPFRRFAPCASIRSSPCATNSRSGSSRAGTQPSPFTASWYLETACRLSPNSSSISWNSAGITSRNFNSRIAWSFSSPVPPATGTYSGCRTRQALRSSSNVRRIRPAFVSDTSAVRL